MIIAVGCLIVLCLYLFFRAHRYEILAAKMEQQARRSLELETLLKNKQLEVEQLKVSKATLEAKLQESLSLEEKYRETFKALSADALEKNNQTFLHLAKTTLEKFQESAKTDLDVRKQSIEEFLKPVKENLRHLDQGIQHLEKERKSDHQVLRSHMHQMIEAEKELKSETANLVKALRTPLARGRWGEIQLKRVVELAGMINHCDFYEQQHHVGIEEERLRPDLIVKLPGGRQVVIDAKVPLEAYLEAIATQDENLRLSKLDDHARQIRAHVSMLSKKSYWHYFQPTPEFVVLFLASETFFSAALERDPSLIDLGAEQGVIIATPTTLIALLRAVAYGWKQESLSRHAEQVKELGQDLHKRIMDMAQHFSKMGRSLGSAIDAYNKGIGSFETRVMVTARKFQELGAASATFEAEPLEMIEKTVRPLQEDLTQ